MRGRRGCPCSETMKNSLIRHIAPGVGRPHRIGIPCAEKFMLPHRIVSIGVWILFGISLVWAVGGAFLGYCEIQDESYMALCCREYGQQPMAMLTFYCGWLLTDVFGDQILVLRLFAILCVLVSILIPCRYFYKQTGNIDWTIFISTVCIVVVKCTRNDEFYGWDSFPMVFISLLLTVLVSYLKQPDKRKAYIASAILGALVLSRVPSGVVAIPVCIYVVLKGADRLPIKRGVLFMTCAGITIGIILLLLTLMTGNPLNYIHALKPENIINGHTLTDVFQGPDHNNLFISNLKYIAGSYRLFWGSFLALFILFFIKEKSRTPVGLLLLLILVTANFLTIRYRLYPLFSIAALGLFYPDIRNFVYSRLTGDYRSAGTDWLFNGVIIMFMFAPAIGSNQFLIRITAYYCIPLLMARLYNYRNGMIKWFLAFMIIPALLFGVYKFAEDFKDRTGSGHLPHRAWMFEHKNNIDMFLPLERIVDELKRKDEEFLFIGDGRYEPTYIYKEGETFNLNHFHYFDKEETRELFRKIPGNTDAVIIMRQDLISMSYDEIREEMLGMGYEVTDSAGMYDIYEHKIMK